MTIAALRDHATIDMTTKGFPVVEGPVPVADVAARGWSFADLRPPVMVLRETALAHNLALMASFCREHGVAIAPHGKTTMAPRLWERQLRAGAWGLTAATVGQARVMADAGVERILIANEVVDPASISWLASAAATVRCSVDSERGVGLLEEGMSAGGAERAFPVLVELGHGGGRTGCRSVPEALDLCARVGRSRSLTLAGVIGYEGTICSDRSADCLDAVRSFLDDLRSLATAVLDAGRTDELIVSAGGSAYFDLVVERLADWPPDTLVTVLLRSGCYLTHDVGHYERLSPFAGAPEERRFHPAIEIWGSVLSTPEPGLAIAGIGRRDVPFDLDLSSPRWRRTAEGAIFDVHGQVVVTALQDQHAFCRVGEGVVEVGDLLGCGILHPCSAFDRWRAIPVLDDEDRVVDGVATYF